MKKSNFFFVSIPKRILTEKFNHFLMEEFSTHRYLVVKRREPIEVRDELGGKRIEWQEIASEEEVEQALEQCKTIKNGTLILNIENYINKHDQELLRSNDLHVLLSGVDLTLEEVKKVCENYKNKSIFIAIENLDLLLKSTELVKLPIKGIVIGTSYLSESSIMYDQLGLEKFRSLLKTITNLCKRKRLEVISSTNYCTFEIERGIGDRSKKFVLEQIKMIHDLKIIGISRSYLHFRWYDEYSKQEYSND